MRFLPFVDFNDYSVGYKPHLKQALVAFFNTPRLKGYYDAIARSGTPILKESILAALQQFIGEVISEKNENDVAIKAIAEKQKMIQDIEYSVSEEGTNALDLEHKKAIQHAMPFQLMSFDEYLAFSWDDIDCKAEHLKPTIFQWKYYLSYVNTLVLPYANTLLHTENRKQAISFGEKRQTIIAKIDQMESRLLESSTNLFHIKGAIKQNRDKYSSYEIQLIQCIPGNLQPASEAILDETEVEIEVELIKSLMLNLDLTYKDLEAQRCKIQTLVNENLALYSTSSGELDRESEIVQLIQPELNYWRDNLPRIEGRQADCSALQFFSTTIPQVYNETLGRFITSGELTSLEALKQFSQSPTNSLEREKWFFGTKACPGSGVTHAYRCEIQLKSGTLALLDKLSKPDNEYATVVKKENEQDCIGIHEDALPLFNSLISKVTAYNTAGMDKNKQAEIDFTKKDTKNEAVAFKNSRMRN